MYLQFVGGRSLSDAAMSVFADDMRLLGRDDILRRVAAVQEETVLIQINYTYCLILPDKDVILWRFHNAPGNRRVLNWNRGEDFPSTECTTHRSTAEWCGGVVISPDGNLGR
jgi:hypothetical protein